MATKKTTRKSTASKSRAKSTRKSPTKKTTARKRTPKPKAQPAPAPQAEVQSTAPESPVRFIRNLRGVPAAVRLERHDKKRRIELKPRGQRGDLAPIQPEDLHDPVFINNLGLLYEVITAAEAAEVATKQTTNQQAHHPALSTIRNPLGDEYPEDAVQVEELDSEQGTVVAELEDGNVVVDRRGIRRRGEGPGTPAEVAGAEPGHQPANEQERYLSDDARARSKDTVSPTDILGGRTAVLEPTQKT